MSLPALIQGLLLPTAYPHPVGTVRLIETHISWVLIADEFAYKVKKPIDLGFLDFSTLDRRRFCCAEEVRLNRRLAPEIYLGSVPITGPVAHPRLDGEGPALEWAVRMRAFPADATLDREACVTPEQIDAIADTVARFHADIDPAPGDSEFGTPEAVWYPVDQNFQQIRGLDPAALALPVLERVEAWSRAEFNRLGNHFSARKRGGYVRECHGDLHLGNIAWVHEQPLIFDCIEFNPKLRFIDITSEVAFLFMDLMSRGLEGLAWRFHNRWLELSGDYDGLTAFRFYLVYRAMVRAKVAGIRGAQGDPHGQQDMLTYLHLAERLAQPSQPFLILMHGLSGSGKTWLSQRLLENLGCLRLRSDVERKRLAGLPPTEPSQSGLATGIYSADMTQRTFSHLRSAASRLLMENYPVIVDATFLQSAARHPFLGLAADMSVPLRIVSLLIAPERLQSRILGRQARGGDASEADLSVLAQQLRNSESLDGAESSMAIMIDVDDDSAWADTPERWRMRLGLVAGRTRPEK
jgi:hypothetical protein